MLKLYRRLDSGPHPEEEVTRYLTETARFSFIPPLLGSLRLHTAPGAEKVLGVLQGFVANQGDGWRWTLAYLDRFLTDLAEQGGQKPSPDYHAAFLSRIRTLGRRIATMHQALAWPTADPAFRPEPLTDADVTG
ncbi:MAG: maltose alpha-D-glucosyltransferase [Rhodospirillaceae bacterium]|nr:MAG: maltose alpha-D-glucosyltransferase [Rhodospirillaceae bacterium]